MNACLSILAKSCSSGRCTSKLNNTIAWYTAIAHLLLLAVVTVLKDR